MRSRTMCPVSWSSSYLLREPVGISITARTVSSPSRSCGSLAIAPRLDDDAAVRRPPPHGPHLRPEIELLVAPAEAALGRGHRQRTGRQPGSRLWVVVGARRDVVGRVRVEERGEVLDLPASGTELELPAAVH